MVGIEWIYHVSDQSFIMHLKDGRWLSPDDKPSSSLVSLPTLFASTSMLVVNQPTSTYPKPSSLQVLVMMNQEKYDNCMWIEYYDFNLICHPVEAAVSNAELESAWK